MTQKVTNDSVLLTRTHSVSKVQNARNPLARIWLMLEKLSEMISVKILSLCIFLKQDKGKDYTLAVRYAVNNHLKFRDDNRSRRNS